MDACLLILRTVVHFYDNANTTRESNHYYNYYEYSYLAMFPSFVTHY